MARLLKNYVINSVNNIADSIVISIADTQDIDIDKDIDVDLDLDKTTPRASETASERRARSAPLKKEKGKEITKGEKSYDLEDFFQAALERALE